MQLVSLARTPYSYQDIDLKVGFLRKYTYVTVVLYKHNSTSILVMLNISFLKICNVHKI